MTRGADDSEADPPGREEGEGKLFAMAMVLAALAGFVDATGYIHFHHLFVSFMSGNSTQAMAAAAGHDTGKLLLVGRTILLFVAGVTLGELLAAASRQWGRTLVLLVETILLGAALASQGLGTVEAASASALALAMGVQNAAIHKAEGISLALTYVTGTLVHIGRGIAKALRGEATLRAVLPFAALWVGLVAGGFTGATIAGRSLPHALAAAAGASLVLLLWAALDAAIECGRDRA